MVTAFASRPDGARYDLVLVVEYFRSLGYYLSIIKYLGRRYRIGLYPVQFEAGLLAKNAEAQTKFIQKALELGATMVEKGRVTTKTLVVPQRPYLPEALNDVSENIRAARTVGVLSLAWAGLHDEFLKRLGIRKVFVLDRRFFDFLLQQRAGRSHYQEIVEVGLPFQRYPVFPEVRADYILAMPTPFSFPHEPDKWHFLETILTLFKEIDPADTIIYKAHNGHREDYFSRPLYSSLSRAFGNGSGANRVLKTLASSGPAATRSHLGQLYTAYLHRRVLERVIPLDCLTEIPEVGLEAFLAGVKRGVIGGLSNTIWTSLFYRLPFYNCVDISRQDRNSKARLYGKKDPSNLLDLNLRYFLVPYCNGRLSFDPKHFDLIDAGTRNGDLIAELEREIQRAPEASFSREGAGD